MIETCQESRGKASRKLTNTHTDPFPLFAAGLSSAGEDPPLVGAVSVETRARGVHRADGHAEVLHSRPHAGGRALAAPLPAGLLQAAQGARAQHLVVGWLALAQGQGQKSFTFILLVVVNYILIFGRTSFKNAVDVK